MGEKHAEHEESDSDLVDNLPAVHFLQCLLGHPHDIDIDLL